MITRKPKRTVSAPATGCRNPQARFWIAIASVKSETDMPMSCFIGCMKMPSDWRSPMLKVSITEVPIRIGSVGRRTCNSGIVFSLDRPGPKRKARSRESNTWYTDLFTSAIVQVIPPGYEDIARSHGKPDAQADHEGADSRNRRQVVLSEGDSSDRRRHHCGRDRHQQAHPLQSLSVQGRADFGLSGTPLRTAARIR